MQFHVNRTIRRIRFAVEPLKRSFCIALLLPGLAIYAQDPGNGIHVGNAKIYDARELTLMLDNLNKSLQGKNFIDQSRLATALGNVQGYQNTDVSTALFANGAVGPQAASVFANNLPASSSASSSTSLTQPAAPAPAVSININPASATATTPTTPANTSPTGFGPSAPSLPMLQTAPTYSPTFGPNGNDLLTDETNLTYQIFNLSLLLSRSLTDRVNHHQSRLQAVIGFDIDIEPDAQARDAAAVVEVTASMNGCPSPGEAGEPKEDPDACSVSNPPVVVAMMPEQGSHNAATLTQKANSFGGALAAQVFSVGFSAQKRSQIFYLYRDIDTLALQEPEPDSDQVKHPSNLYFGWQFRPVLGRHTVDAGLRHMLAVLALPATDTGFGSPKLNIQVRTRWVRYQSKTQTTTSRGWLFKHLPKDLSFVQPAVEVPRTFQYQDDLHPSIRHVAWVPSDNLNGVAIVTGDNFFLGTTVRLGNKTFTGSNDGLTLKSDKELELSVPLAAVMAGGVLSGRYGEAKPLENPSSALYQRHFQIRSVKVYPEGSDAAQVIAKLVVYPPTPPGSPVVSCQPSDPQSPGNLIPVDAHGSPIPVDPQGVPVDLASLPKVEREDFLAQVNRPVLLLNAIPVPAPPVLNWNIGIEKSCSNGYPPGSMLLDLAALVPAKDVLKGSPVVSVVFPFEGADWIGSNIFFQPALNIARAGSTDVARLIITSTTPEDALCDGWAVQLDRCAIPVTSVCSAPTVCKAPVPPARAGAAKEVGRAAGGHAHAGKAPAAAEPPAFTPVLYCIDAIGRRKLSLDIAAAQLKNYKQLMLVYRLGSDPATCASRMTDIVDTRLGAIPDAKPKPPAPVITKGPNPPSVEQYSSQTIQLDGINLDQIKTVLFDKTELKIINQDAGSLIISIPRSMTQKPAKHDQIQLISDQNDPLLISLDVNANPAIQKKEN